MPRRLYIGNLSFSVGEAEIGRLFRELGLALADVRVMRDPGSGRSRGFAFADLGSGTDLPQAIEALEGKVVDGRALAVGEARPDRRR